MDPATIIGTTSAVLSFVTFLVQAVRVGRKVHHGATDAGNDTGQTEYAECKKLCKAFQPCLQQLRERELINGAGSLSDVERSTLQIARLCEKVGTDIITLMEKYEFNAREETVTSPGGPEGVRKKIREKVGVRKHTIKVTLRILWEQEEVKELRARFNECALVLNSHLTMLNGSDTLRKFRQLSEHLHAVEDKTSGIYNRLEASSGVLRQNHDDMTRSLNYVVEMVEEFGTVTDDRFARVLGQYDDIAGLQKVMGRILEVSQNTLEAINRRRILRAISFPTRLVRQRQLDRLRRAADTFEWFLNGNFTQLLLQRVGNTLGWFLADNTPGTRPEVSFREWLESGRGIFHISGKPGSGKSTLMNFLQSHEDTMAHLRIWQQLQPIEPAVNGKVVSTTNGELPRPTDLRLRDKVLVASAFLYNAGTSEEQRSFDGVLKTLLYTILEQHRPELIPQIFKKYWNPSGWTPWSPIDDLKIIDSRELKNAFELVLKDTTKSGWRYCIFIDGADEFQDQNMDKWKFANELKGWVTDYQDTVKICISSREEGPWMYDSFCTGETRIRIHHFTALDMKRLVEDRIADHPNFSKFDSYDREQFINTVVAKAEGVFSGPAMYLI